MLIHQTLDSIDGHIIRVSQATDKILINTDSEYSVGSFGKKIAEYAGYIINPFT